MKKLLSAVLLALSLVTLPALARPVQLSQSGCDLVAQMVTEAHIARQNDKPMPTPDSSDRAANAVSRFIIKHIKEYIPLEVSGPDVYMAYIQGCYAAQGQIDLPEEI